MNLLDKHDICFVTNDSGFFNGKGSSNELHGSLASEAKTRAQALRVERDLERILDEFRTEFTINAEVLKEFVNIRSIKITQTAESMGFGAMGPPELNYKAFSTENAGEVEVRFTSVQPFADANGRDTEGLRIEARGVYEMETGKLVDVSMDREGLTYVDEGGNRKAASGSTVYARADPIYLGSKPITSDRRDLVDST